MSCLNNFAFFEEVFAKQLLGCAPQYGAGCHRSSGWRDPVRYGQSRTHRATADAGTEEIVRQGCEVQGRGPAAPSTAWRGRARVPAYRRCNRLQESKMNWRRPQRFRRGFFSHDSLTVQPVPIWAPSIRCSAL